MLVSYNEKSFSSDFCKFIREKYDDGSMSGSACFELKIKKKGQRLNFKSDCQDHQLPALEKAKNSFIYHKISDQSMGAKPFDSFVLNKSKSFLVIMWYEKRAKKEMVFIDITNLLLWREINKKKSITELEARELGFIYQL